MAQIAVLDTVRGISPPYQDGELGTLLFPKIAGGPIISGLALYEDPTTGRLMVADAAVAGHEQCCGLAVNTCALGQGVTLIGGGHVAGFDLSALAFGALVYLDTGGHLADTPNASKTVAIGRVVATSTIDGNGVLRKLLYIFRNWTANF